MKPTTRHTRAMSRMWGYPETQFSRRGFLRTAVALAPALVTGCLRTKEPRYRLRLGTNLPPAHPLNKRLREAAERVRSATHDDAVIELYPAGQLGSDPDMLSQVRNGAIHFLSLSGLIASMLVPEAALSGVGFAFSDPAHLFAALDGAVGAHIRASFSRRGLHAFPHVFENGFRQITSNDKLISSPSDLTGMKIRVPPGAMFTSLIVSLGAMPTSINGNELYTALQTHVVDGQENPLAIVSVLKLFEVQRYCSLTSHMWDGFWILSSEETFASLPLGLRDLISAEFSRAALLQRADVAAQNTSLPSTLRAAGMLIIRPDRDSFRRRLTQVGYYRRWRERLGDASWSVLESAVGELR